MKTCAFVVLLMSVSAALSLAGEVEIISFRNGELTWSNSQVEGTATIEWCPDLLETWQSDWSGLTDVPITASVMTVSVPMFFRVFQRTYAPLTNTMAQVPYSPTDKDYYLAHTIEHPNGYGTYQKDGPEHAFYMSAFEISNDEYRDFLNDAQANQGNARGAHMHFTGEGDVYMDSTQTSSEMLFDISDSRITYAPGASVGNRYSVAASNSRHPAVGVSWYGAVKFCNWYTIAEGRGESQRCYTEGTNPPDWAPVTASSWDLGIFTDSERLAWLTYRGFRMPMDHSSSFASLYNEFYKAAAWNGSASTVYGFGRDLLGGRDANYYDSGDPLDNGTTPVGYYDGSDHGGTFLTRSNENTHAIYDLSGNAEEWTADLYDSTFGFSTTRGGCYGSRYDTEECKAKYRTWRYLYHTSSSMGFRIVSTTP